MLLETQAPGNNYEWKTSLSSGLLQVPKGGAVGLRTWVCWGRSKPTPEYASQGSDQKPACPGICTKRGTSCLRVWRGWCCPGRTDQGLKEPGRSHGAGRQSAREQVQAGRLVALCTWEGLPSCVLRAQRGPGLWAQGGLGRPARPKGSKQGRAGQQTGLIPTQRRLVLGWWVFPAWKVKTGVQAREGLAAAATGHAEGTALAQGRGLAASRPSTCKMCP